MESYVIYTIKVDDTLDSIAKDNHLSVVELIQFHNRHAGITQQIIDGKMPNYLKNLYLLKNDLNIHTEIPLIECPEYINDLVPKYKTEKLYLINLKTSVVLLGHKIAEYENELTWQVNYNTPQHGYLQKSELDNKIVKASPSMDLFNTVMKAMNNATEKLLFSLNNFGELDKVINTSEVLKKWDFNKINHLKSIEYDIPELSSMFKVCDEEFADLASSLKKNLLYTLFFIPLGKIDLSNNKIKLLLSSHQVLSQFFQPFFIPFKFYYRIINDDEGFQLHLTNEVPKGEIESFLKKIFAEKYAELTNSSFDFDYKIEGFYHFGNDGVLRSATIYIREQTNANCFYTAKYEFQLINSD